MAYSQQTRTPNDASRTVTVTPAPAPEEHEQPPQEVGSVRLRGARRQRPHVVWDEAVVDNEGAGKKKSKICCIYHKPRRFDESSDESESESDSDSDSECGHDHARPSSHYDQARPSHAGPSRSGGGGHAHRDGDSGGNVHTQEHAHEPNAYERHPGKGKRRADD